ncbi:unnamed protein product [Auanema sp. JU1783]|nr:unnamed protein product [Auanema sp. JU1783]
MGSKQSQFDKATSPYSSWGSSFDNLLCGPGKICGDQWTPISTRSNSLTSLRRSHEPKTSRNQRRVRSYDSYRSSHRGQAEVFTLNREYSYEDPTEVLTHQPLPSEIVSSPLNDFLVVHKESRRGSYLPKVHPAQSTFSDTNRAWSYRPEGIPKIGRPRTSPSSIKEHTVKKKKRKAANRKSLPAPPPQPIQIFIDLNGTQQQIKLDRNNRANLHVSATKETNRSSRRNKKLAKSSSPPRKRVPSQQTMPLTSMQTSSMRKSVPDLRQHQSQQLPRRRKTKQIEVKPFSKSNASVSGSSNSTLSTRRVIPPKDKLHETPPQPFRFKSVPDKPFTRIMSGKI